MTIRPAARAFKSAVVTVATCLTLAVTGAAGVGYVAVERQIDARLELVTPALDRLAKDCVANPFGAVLCGVMVLAVVNGPVMSNMKAECRATALAPTEATSFGLMIEVLPTFAKRYAVDYVCERTATRGRAAILSRFGG